MKMNLEQSPLMDSNDSNLNLSVSPEYLRKSLQQSATKNFPPPMNWKVDQSLSNQLNRTGVKYDRKAVFEELWETHEESKVANWDGQGATAVTDETYRCAYRFLESLPSHIPSPSVSAEPDGHISFEWHRSVRRTISVSVSPEGELHYSAITGPSKTYGTEQLSGVIPDLLLTLIQRVIT